MYGSCVFFTNRNVYFCVVVFSNYTVIFMFPIKTHFYRFILKRCHVFTEHGATPARLSVSVQAGFSGVFHTFRPGPPSVGAGTVATVFV